VRPVFERLGTAEQGTCRSSQLSTGSRRRARRHARQAHRVQTFEGRNGTEDGCGGRVPSDKNRRARHRVSRARPCAVAPGARCHTKARCRKPTNPCVWDGRSSRRSARLRRAGCCRAPGHDLRATALAPTGAREHLGTTWRPRPSRRPGLSSTWGRPGGHGPRADRGSRASGDDLAATALAPTGARARGRHRPRPVAASRWRASPLARDGSRRHAAQRAPHLHPLRHPERPPGPDARDPPGAAGGFMRLVRPPHRRTPDSGCQGLPHTLVSTVAVVQLVHFERAQAVAAERVAAFHPAPRVDSSPEGQSSGSE
jgi:hypothetical protein